MAVLSHDEEATDAELVQAVDRQPPASVGAAAEILSSEASSRDGSDCGGWSSGRCFKYSASSSSSSSSSWSLL